MFPEAKKQRTIQAIDIHEIPKPKPKNGFNAKNKGNFQGFGTHFGTLKNYFVKVYFIFKNRSSYFWSFVIPISKEKVLIDMQGRANYSVRGPLLKAGPLYRCIWYLGGLIKLCTYDFKF